MDHTKNKGPNLTAADKEALIEIVMKFQDIVENKKTDAVFAKTKRDCWDNQIALEYNSSGVRYKRSGAQLQCIYKNMKSRLKKDIAKDRAGIFQTGGGTYRKKVDENNRLLQVVEKECTPLSNSFDSCSDYWENVCLIYNILQIHIIN